MLFRPQSIVKHTDGSVYIVLCRERWSVPALHLVPLGDGFFKVLNDFTFIYMWNVEAWSVVPYARMSPLDVQRSVPALGGQGIIFRRVGADMPLLRDAFAQPCPYEYDDLLLLVECLRITSPCHSKRAAIIAICEYICKDDPADVRSAYIEAACSKVPLSETRKLDKMCCLLTEEVCHEMEDTEFDDFKDHIKDRAVRLKQKAWAAAKATALAEPPAKAKAKAKVRVGSFLHRAAKRQRLANAKATTGPKAKAAAPVQPAVPVSSPVPAPPAGGSVPIVIFMIPWSFLTTHLSI